MTEQFVDLSHHNEVADLAAYARAGHTRVALKATEGTSFTDPAFVGRWREAGRVGLRRGAYHFARTTTGGAAQADRLLAAVEAAGGMGAGDWLVLDLEDEEPGAVSRAADFAGEFCRRMVARGHPDGLIYTRTGYAVPVALWPGDVPAGWRRLWLANYRAGETDTQIALPAPWTRAQVAARQYTNAGTVPGITGPVDISRVLTDWITEDDMALSAEDLENVHDQMRRALEEFVTYPGSGPLVRLGRSEGWGSHLDETALADALAEHLPAVTADQIAQALAQIKVTTTTTVTAEPTR